MKRRSFLSMLGGIAAAATFDPERALWTPGKKLISVPKQIVLPVPSASGFYVRNGMRWEHLDATRMDFRSNPGFYEKKSIGDAVRSYGAGWPDPGCIQIEFLQSMSKASSMLMNNFAGGDGALDIAMRFHSHGLYRAQGFVHGLRTEASLGRDLSAVARIALTSPGMLQAS